MGGILEFTDNVEFHCFVTVKSVSKSVVRDQIIFHLFHVIPIHNAFTNMFVSFLEQLGIQNPREDTFDDKFKIETDYG